MVTQKEPKKPAGSGNKQPDYEPATGYARLSLVRFRAWQVLLVLIVLIGASLLLFPRQRMLVDFYLERGRTEEALDGITRMLERDPDNPELLNMAAEARFQTGDMAEAVHLQERAAGSAPERLGYLSRLATLYEWNRNPKDALKAYELITARDPSNKDALIKIIELSRHLGYIDREGLAVARLVELENDSDEAGDPLLRELTGSLETLSLKRIAEGPDPLLDELLGRLYLVRLDYLDERLEGGIPSTTETETAEAALHFFLVTGHLEEGQELAVRLDQGLQKGVSFQLAWADFLRWNGLSEEALALLIEAHEQEPENADIARTAVETAWQTGDVQNLIAPLERRLGREPDSEKLRVFLADLHRAAGDPVRVFNLYESLLRDHPNNPEYMAALITAAEGSPVPALKERAADLAGEAVTQDAELLKRRAELYVAAQAPQKALPLLSVLAARSGGDKEAVERMMEVAGFTNDPASLEKTLSEALGLRPSDQALRRRAADTFFWTEGAGESYRTQLDLIKKPGATREDVFRLIELAGYTGRPEHEREAIALAAKKLRGPGVSILKESPPPYEVPASDESAFAAVRDYLDRYPKDRAFMDLLIQHYLKSGRPGLAAPLLADLSDRAPDDFQKALDAGDAYLQGDRLKNGLPYFEHASSLNPEDVSLRRRLMTYYGWVGLREKQIAQMVLLEEDGLLKEEERIQLAEAFLEMREGARALEILRPAEAEDPLRKREGFLLATAYEISGNKDGALAVYDRLARSHADDPSLLAELGDRALWLDRAPAALAFYEASLRRDPKNLRALKGSGLVYAWNNDPQRAAARLEEYLSLNPDDFEIRYQLGELYFADQREAEALKEHQKALNLMDQMKREVSPRQPSSRNTGIHQ